MDLQSLRTVPEDRICAVFGIPPELIVHDGNTMVDMALGDYFYDRAGRRRFIVTAGTYSWASLETAGPEIVTRRAKRRCAGPARLAGRAAEGMSESCGILGTCPAPCRSSRP